MFKLQWSHTNLCKVALKISSNLHRRIVQVPVTIQSQEFLMPSQQEHHHHNNNIAGKVEGFNGQVIM